jgi:hypothetical protein
MSIAALVLAAFADGPHTIDGLVALLGKAHASVAREVARLRAADIVIPDGIEVRHVASGRRCRPATIYRLSTLRERTATTPGGPRLRVGEGDRRDDCVRYSTCLAAFAARHRDATDAHCPAACAHFTPLRRVAIEERRKAVEW